MKVVVLLVPLLMVVCTAGTFAEDAVVESPKRTGAAAAAEPQQKLQAEEKLKAALEKKPRAYSGLVHDFKRAENKRKFFSLRQPRDPKNDLKNVSFDETTEKPRGFVLFRVEF